MVRQSYFYNENSNTGKMVSSYWDVPLDVTPFFTNALELHLFCTNSSKFCYFQNHRHSLYPMYSDFPWRSWRWQITDLKGWNEGHHPCILNISTSRIHFATSFSIVKGISKGAFFPLLVVRLPFIRNLLHITLQQHSCYVHSGENILRAFE